MLTTLAIIRLSRLSGSSTPSDLGFKLELYLVTHEPQLPIAVTALLLQRLLTLHPRITDCVILLLDL